MDANTINDAATIRGGDESVLGRIDKYELVRELGEGGFGTVYLARDTVADVDVAVKGLPPEVKHNAVELESIRGNFALVKRLRHPNIVAVTDLHQALSVSYASKDVESKLRVFERDTMVVMDYAPGVTLAQWRRQFPGGKVPLDKAIAVVRQVASALDYAHAQKVLHRDVKPANVMVESADGGKLVARVLDFGLAAEIRSSMGRLSREIRDTSGTRPYMAPEQWKGERQGPATDQYALAAMFYELVVGEVPFASVFDCGDPAVMRLAVTTDAPAIPADLPKCVRKALAVALAKKPEERFASCVEFVAALEGKVKVPRKGGDGIAALAAAALAIVALAGGVWWWHGRQTSGATVHEAPVTPLSPDHAPPTPPVVDTPAEPVKPAEPAKPADAKSSGEKPAAVNQDGRMVAGPDQVALMLDAMQRDLKSRVSKDLKGEELLRIGSIFAGNAKAILQRNTNSVVAAPFKTGDTKTLTLPGGVEMEMIYVGPGTFTMGSPSSEEGRENDETPHRVTLTKGFWLGKYEVTQKQWRSVMGSNPSVFKSVFKGDSNPVENVSWNDCQEFVRKVNDAARRQFGGSARLPTEAEWEYACRAGTTTAYCWGNALNGDRANCDGNYPCGTTAKGPYRERTVAVGSYQPNAWGFCDMHGNVWEWCQDWYGDYPVNSVTDPHGSASGGYRVLRGGCWFYYARGCRSARRSRHDPGHSGNNVFGFRLCCSAQP